jgi:hypothetical protein
VRACLNKVSGYLPGNLGDYNLDGYPDILIPFMDIYGNTVVELWQNVPCTVTLCGSDATENNLRTFQVVISELRCKSDH